MNWKYQQPSYAMQDTELSSESMCLAGDLPEGLPFLEAFQNDAEQEETRRAYKSRASRQNRRIR